MTNDILFTVVLVAFLLGFAYLAFAFLHKKRKERIAELTELLPAQKPVQKSKWGFKRFDDDALLGELETTLLRADVGMKTTQKLLEAVKGVTDPVIIRDRLKKEIQGILKIPLKSPFEKGVIMFVGVNGVGKTTIIGKLASRFKAEGKSVLLGAGDTFRAAAADQLTIWSERAGVPIVTGKADADPASVLFDAVSKAKQDNTDIVLCDTAGRLHTKSNLMEELKKVHRVIGKACPGAPHEVWLVLDGTTGQNALLQAKQFSEATPLTGIILNKLDGTAKGGIVIGICSELNIPIRFIGVGEGIEDLRPFDAEAFVDALF